MNGGLKLTGDERRCETCPGKWSTAVQASTEMCLDLCNNDNDNHHHSPHRLEMNLQSWRCDHRTAAANRSLISQEVGANNGVNNHLWCEKCQLIPTDILSPSSCCTELQTGTWSCPVMWLAEEEEPDHRDFLWLDVSSKKQAAVCEGLNSTALVWLFKYLPNQWSFTSVYFNSR